MKVSSKVTMRRIAYIISQNVWETHAAFWSCYEEVASAKQPAVENEHLQSPHALELNSYFHECLLHHNLSTFAWWAKYQKKYTHWTNVTKIFLSAPFTYFCIQRMFVFQSRKWLKWRSWLLPGREQSLIFLQHNITFLT